MRCSKKGAERIGRLIAVRDALLGLEPSINYGIFRPGALVTTDKGEQHPDSRTIRKWITKRRADAVEFDIMMWWADWVLQEWAMAPRLTVVEHRRRFVRVAKLCSELREALNSTAADFAGGTGAGLREAALIGLLTMDDAQQLIRAALDENGFINADLLTLKIETLLERLGMMATRLAEQGPIHSQPSKHGAERGYFVRRMGDLFQRRYGGRPHEVIAALTTIAIGEATDRELVAKLLA